MRAPSNETLSGTDDTLDAPGPPAPPPDHLAPADELAPGDCLGRYTVRALIGAGGMGEVYAAHDPQLDRSVALKILHPRIGGSSPDRRARFQREAQAMARLNHPNVVSVFDVGTVGSRMFVAMELVEGPTLAAWLAERLRPWREVVDVFLQAGRGLGAAHAAGIVHRDFKPSNVILGERVRVADFGLARMERDADPPPSPSLLHTAITHAGRLVGTPAYMAPEQRAGAPASAQSDQYSFALALQEALGGVGPGWPIPPGAVPRRLRAVVERALQPCPARRYPSMAELCADLARDPARTRRRAVAAVAIAAVAAFALLAPRESAPPSCGGGAARLAGIWDASRKDAVHAAFAATRLPYAEDAWRRARAHLDDYAARWLAMEGETCRATRIEGRQSDALMDLRMACLERRRGLLGALTELWSHGMGADSLRAVYTATYTLPPLAECADARALTERRERPPDPALAARVEAVRVRLDAVQALSLSHRLPEARAQAAAVRVHADATGWPQLRAEAAFAEGDVLVKLEHPGAEPLLLDAARLAGAARDDRLAARAFIDLVENLGENQQTAARALLVADLADGAVERAGGDRVLRAGLLRARGLALHSAGKMVEARAALVAAHAVAVDALGPRDPGTFTLLVEIARIADEQGDFATARRLDAQALAALLPVLGPDHPRIGGVLINLAATVEHTGDHDAAVGYFRWALAVQERAYGPESVAVAITLQNLANIEIYRGHLDEAEALQTRALAVRERLLGAEHPHVASSLTGLAHVRRKQGHPDEALALAERALAIDTRALGQAHPKLAFDHGAIALAYEARGQLAAALASYRRELAVREQALGAGHPATRDAGLDVAAALVKLRRTAEARRLVAGALAGEEAVNVAGALALRGACELLDGRPARALPDLERALALQEATSEGAIYRGLIRWRQAQALAALGRVEAARAAARRAVAELAGDADGAGERAAALAWLARHDGARAVAAR